MNQQNMGTQSNLLRCPRCFLDGKTNVIAELLPNGDIGIERQRAKWGYENMTIVHGSNFELICGYCREKVFATINSKPNLLKTNWQKSRRKRPYYEKKAN